MVIDKAHGLTLFKRLQCAKDGGMAKALGNTACVKAVDGKVQCLGGVHGFFLVFHASQRGVVAGNLAQRC